jgi:hypothetical protein
VFLFSFFALALFAVLVPSPIKSAVWTLLGTLITPFLVFVSILGLGHFFDIQSTIPYLLAVTAPLPLFVFNVWKTTLPLWVKIIAPLVGIPGLALLFIFSPVTISCALFKNCL